MAGVVQWELKPTQRFIFHQSLLSPFYPKHSHHHLLYGSSNLTAGKAIIQLP
jgi:hypothetical protein